MKEIIVKLRCTRTGKESSRTISASNVYNHSGGGYGTRDTQETKLNNWIMWRANAQSNTILELVDWELT